MAYRMQSSVPDVTDLSQEPDSIFELYGPDSRKPGTFAAIACWRGGSPSVGSLHSALPSRLGSAWGFTRRHSRPGRETDQPSAR